MVIFLLCVIAAALVVIARKPTAAIAPQRKFDFEQTVDSTQLETRLARAEASLELDRKHNAPGEKSDWSQVCDYPDPIFGRLVDR